ncbi:PQQ-dependent sugar dehydrogenase [Fodinicola acaciae]|uniref:PQQ-dependent sugar dehydrogenase n=1 Tax=Fodinicola acaciae TaxID=2681555 RepID=UPI0013D3C55B|nr:PQQ-dependent sugar dehydrogenase [Fodinicola acaciae]
MRRLARIAAVSVAALTAAGLSAPATAAPTRYEAEAGSFAQAVVESNHQGFSGAGFVNTDNVAGAYVQFAVNAASAGTATVTIGYSNGTTVNRPGDVAVNGVVVSANRAFAGTGSWDTWATSTLSVPVKAGANTVRLTSTTAEGLPNLDYLDVEAAAQSADYQAEDATISQGTVANNHAGFTGSGFVDYTNIAGSYVQFTVNAAAAGSSSLTFRYANGTTVDRPMDISVNGTVVSSGLSFPGTTNWDTWATKAVNARLNAGNNTIRATATTANGGPNLDRLTVSGAADSQPPTTPGTTSCSDIGENQLTLHWGAATDNVGVVAYDIYEHGNKLAEAAGNATSQVLNGLTPNTTYTLAVTARDAAGNASPATTPLQCKTLPSSDTTPPSAPENLAHSNVTANSVKLTWSASTDNRGVTSYDVRSGTTVYQTVTGNPPATSTTLTGLACNSPYSLNVVAHDAAGNVSAQSNADSFTTQSCSTDGGVPSSITTISTGWSIPWGTYWMPDGQTALVTERDSFKVFKVTPSGAKTQVGSVPNAVTTNGEGGLLGVAVDPAWSTNHYVYFMHTASEGNRIVRMTYDGASLSGYKILLQGIKKNQYHNGGRLLFGPDGYLYASTGEAQTPDLAQDKNSLNGKILRLTTDGKPAPGNPFGNYVYSYGHRNPQGLAFDRNGRLWEAEFGNSKYDELNLIKPGANYGWPTCEGNCGTTGMTNPKATWPVSQASPSGIAIVRNVVYMAALRGERMWRIPINGDSESVGTPTAYYVGTYGRLRTVTKVPGADQLWLSTTNADNNGNQPDGSDKIFRVTIA